jgi:hypothetical protein
MYSVNFSCLTHGRHVHISTSLKNILKTKNDTEGVAQAVEDCLASVRL